MSRELINRNPDLKQLRSDGYNIDVHSGYLLVKDVPYVTARREVKRGILASTLNLAGDMAVRPDDHQVHFVGEQPCHAHGSPMHEVISSMGAIRLDDTLTASFSFSQKPQRGYYETYYEKMTTYAAILSSQAQAIDPEATPRVYRVDEPDEEDSPFNYMDTASSRAEINTITKKLRLSRIAIVGLGGTGSYVLDLTAKTPVKAIHVFDKDVYGTHNAFRAPGAPSIEALREQPNKVNHFKGIYANMHRGIVAHPYHIDASNIEELRGMDFVFLCLDRGGQKALLLTKLEEFRIPFIDVGMGIQIKGDALCGTLRVTTSTDKQRKEALEKGGISLADGDGDNEYDKNIQIADLNALNAALAVVRWKQHFGFYSDLEPNFLTTYTIETNLLTSETIA